MIIPEDASRGPVLEEAARELEAAIHDARVAFDCIALGELDRAHISAVTARVAIDAAMTALRAVLDQPPAGLDDLRSSPDVPPPAGLDDLRSSPDLRNPRMG
jgi:outer membrane protein TolC